MSVFGVILVLIFPHFSAFRLNTERYGVFSRNAVKCGRNADHNNSKYGQFLKTKRIMLVRRKFIFLCVDSYFDVSNLSWTVADQNANCVSTYFCAWCKDYFRLWFQSSFRQKQMLNQFQKRFAKPKRKLKAGKYSSYFAQTFRKMHWANI